MEALHLTPATIAFAIAIALIAWRIYRRVRRLIGRQRSKAWRHWAAAVFFPLLIVLLLLPALRRPEALAVLAAAIVTGPGLAIWGIKLTRFEVTPEGIFYTPNLHIGIALTLLLVARIAYRMLEVATMPAARGPAQMQDFARSPLTIVVLGVLASYYTAYAIGMLVKRRALAATPPSPT